LWTNGDFPTKDSLDIYFPDIPVYLYRIDYHTAVVNSKALEIAQLDSAYILEGGLILTDSLGDPNGVLVDNATAIVSRFIPEPVGNELLRQLRQIQDSLFSVGLTSIVDAGLDRNQLDILQKFYVDDSLKIRNYAMIMAEPHGIDKYIRDGVFQSERLTIRAVKLLADGALGSRGACLLQPYSDTTMSGFLLHPIDEFEESLRRLSKTGFQVATHAIGDSTNRVILDLYGKYLGEENNKRWRIEHAQIVDSADFVKFAKYKIIPSVQPTHATSDMYWAEKRLGQQRVKNAYAYRRLLDQYGKVAIGSDFPVEHINPLYGFHAAVARVDKTGYPNGGFQPDDALTREEALRGMTIWAAYACFQEKSRGSIQKGKDADFVILDKDIMTIPLGEIRDTKIRRTVVAGETVYLQ
jgi:predicted amidohydrolase YtcJ